MNLKSIQVKIATLCGGTLLLTAGVIVGVSVVSLRGDAIVGEENTAKVTAQSNASEFASQLNSAIRTAGTLADTLGGIHDDQVELDISREATIGILKSIVANHPEIRSVYTAWEEDAFDGLDVAYADVEGSDASGRFVPYVSRNESGEVIVRSIVGLESSTPGAGGVPEGQPYLQARSSMAPIAIGPHQVPGDASGDLLVSTVVPVIVNETFYGIVGVDIETPKLEEAIGEVETLLVSPGGLVAAWSGRPDATGQSLSDLSPEFWSAVQDAESQGAIAEWSSGTLRSIYPFKPSGVEQGWYSIVSIPESVAMSGVVAVLQRQVLISAVMVLAGLALSFFAAGAIAKPIANAARMMRDIAEGEGDLTRELEVRSKDEVGELSHWFNALVSNIREVLLDVRKVGIAVDEAAGQVREHSQSVMADMESQGRQTNMVASAVEEMAASASEVSSKLGDTSSNATQAGQLAEEGNQVVERTVESIRSVSESIGEASRSILELSERSDQIGDIISVINDIADQTNLLALNAAIEAARAGEHGRGFAVVADEVRKLAERTTKATEEVGSVIADIQLRTKNAGEHMTQSTERMESGAHLAAEAGDALGHILVSSRGVSSDVQAIAEASSQQSQASSEVAQSIEEINALAQRTGQSIASSNKSIEGMVSQSASLRNLLGRFKLD